MIEIIDIVANHFDTTTEEIIQTSKCTKTKYLLPRYFSIMFVKRQTGKNWFLTETLNTPKGVIRLSIIRLNNWIETDDSVRGHYEKLNEKLKQANP